MWDNLTVKGFHFDSPSEYADARKEAEVIDHICEKMDIYSPEIALKVYTKLLDKKTFHTIVGICFLKKLRDIICENEIIEEAELRTILSPSLTFARNSASVGDETALEHADVASEFAESVDAVIPEGTDAQDEKQSDKDGVSKSPRQNGKKAENTLALQSRIRKLYIVIAVLAAVVALLFGIAIHNNNLTFMDKEMALQDKYSEWEEQLTARERAVTEREKALEEVE